MKVLFSLFLDNSYLKKGFNCESGSRIESQRELYGQILIEIVEMTIYIYMYMRNINIHIHTCTAKEEKK